ncbi:MAG: hypothetical protein LC749_15560 [Actinobacteria bacterium]|nr:hypothetical protein [Actinomycetota bacterium]
MTEPNARSYCGECRTPLDESPSTSAEDREPCPSCRSTSRFVSLHVTETITVHESVGLKARHGRGRTPFREVRSGADLHRDTGEWRTIHRVIDRENDHYDEVVTSADGHVVREVHEPLSQHTGRGAAKQRRQDD